MSGWDRQPPRPGGPGAPTSSSRGGGRPPHNGRNGQGRQGPSGVYDSDDPYGRERRRRNPDGSQDGYGRQRQPAPADPRRAGGRDPRTAIVPPPGRSHPPDQRREPAWDAPHEPQRMRGRGGQGDGPPGRRPGPPGSGRPPAHRGEDEDEAPSRQRRSWKQRIILGFGIFLVLVMLIGAGVAGYFWNKWRQLDTFGDDVDTDVVAEGEPENFLLIGSDQRDSETPRSDTIMILRVDPETHAAQALSFQRDLMVEIAATGEENKINSSFNTGAAGVVDTIRHNFGIPIHHVIEIDFEGFRRLVDQVGGLELWMDQAVRDEDAGLYIEQLGCVNLNGDQALAFARSRKLEYMEDGEWQYDVTSDHGRVLRQQILIRQALSKAVNESGVADLNSMLDIVIDTVTLSDSLNDIGKLRELAGVLEGFSTTGLTPYAMPFIEVGDPGSADLYPDWDTADPILNVFRGLPPDEISPRRVTVSVLNGSGEEGQADNVAGALDRIGFQIGERGNAPEPATATTIQHAPGEEALAQRVARHLDSGAQLVVDESLESGNVTLVTGSDFTRLHEEPSPQEESPSTTTVAATEGAGAAAASQTTAATTATTAAPPAGGGGEGGEGGSTTTSLPPPPERVGHAVGEPPPGQECG